MTAVGRVPGRVAVATGFDEEVRGRFGKNLGCPSNGEPLADATEIDRVAVEMHEAASSLKLWVPLRQFGSLLHCWCGKGDVFGFERQASFVSEPTQVVMNSRVEAAGGAAIRHGGCNQRLEATWRYGDPIGVRGVRPHECAVLIESAAFGFDIAEHDQCLVDSGLQCFVVVGAVADGRDGDVGGHRACAPNNRVGPQLRGRGAAKAWHPMPRWWRARAA